MSSVQMNFAADDGQELARAYTVRDLDEYRASKESGQHDRIIDQILPSIRNEIGPSARYVSTTVDGVLQDD